MENERLKKQLEFCREIDKEKFIGRQTYKSDAQTKENDAEHAWHMAVMTVLLSEYANEKIDVLKTVTMLLIHDIVEIDAGDTYAYDEEGKKTQREREVKAADRIFGILPDDQRDNFRKPHASYTYECTRLVSDTGIFFIIINRYFSYFLQIYKQAGFRLNSSLWGSRNRLHYIHFFICYFLSLSE